MVALGVLMSALLATVTMLHTVSSACNSTGTGCITESSSSCRDLPNGDYQACEGCTFYHSCFAGVTWANRPCPLTVRGGLNGRLVWRSTGPDSGYCDYFSSTCTECVSDKIVSCLATGAGCITASPDSCKNLADGDYQACEGCTFYHSCFRGVTWANRLCPITNQGGLHGRLVWNSMESGKGVCDYSSSTCAECSVTVPSELTCNTNRNSKVLCITASATSCASLADGDYQACESCNVYHSCSNQIISANRPCPNTADGGRLFWVTEGSGVGHCDYTSSTCDACQ